MSSRVIKPSHAELEAGAKELYQALDLALVADECLFVGRNGSTELETILAIYPIDANATLLECAGIWNYYEDWVSAAKQATEATDIYAAGWYKLAAEKEADWLKDKSSIKVPLETLEPYYLYEHVRWTKLLEGQRVATISPFAESFVKQYKKRAAIWGGNVDTILPPNMTLLPVVTGFAPRIAASRATWPPGITNWMEAVDYVVDKTVAENPNVVLIGCGAMGMIIGHKLYQRGLIVIVVGGALQVLFGLKGRRWEDHIVHQFWNDAWIWPPEDQTPNNADIIEGGCYFGGKNP
jgi:hypothetical protein